jgi:hypothetical protein
MDYKKYFINKKLIKIKTIMCDDKRHIQGIKLIFDGGDEVNISADIYKWDNECLRLSTILNSGLPPCVRKFKRKKIK